jgi:hypothetical protein
MPAEGAVAEIVTVELALYHVFPVDGDVVPKLVTMVNWYCGCCVFHCAVSVIALFMVTELELLVPLYDPLPDPLHEVKKYRIPVPPDAGVVTPKLADELALYQP